MPNDQATEQNYHRQIQKIHLRPFLFTPVMDPWPPASSGFDPESLSANEGRLRPSLDSSLAANGTVGKDARVVWVGINKGCAGFSPCGCMVDSVFRASAGCCNRVSMDGWVFSGPAACSFLAAPRKDRLAVVDVGETGGGVETV